MLEIRRQGMSPYINVGPGGGGAENAGAPKLMGL